jgi:hypothetical protein
MVTFEEFSKIAELIEKNKQTPSENVVCEYGDWFSTDGENFSKVDEDSNTFEVNDHCQLRYLGKGLQGFGIFKEDPTWGPLFDDIEQRRNAQVME